MTFNLSPLAQAAEEDRGEFDLDVSGGVDDQNGGRELDFLNVWVAGVPMVSIPIKSEAQRVAYNKVDQGRRDGEVFIAKMSKSINIPKG